MPAFITLFSVLAFSTALSQTGTVKRVMKDDRATVKWESGDASPVAGSMGIVADNDHNLALFRVLVSEGRTSTVEILDSIWPDVVMRGETAALQKEVPEPTPPDRASLYIWSGHTGRSVSVDGNPAGRTPTQLLLAPGFHEILVELPAGGKAGALVQARAGDSEVLLLGGKIPRAKDGMGPAYLRRHPGWRRDSFRTSRHLLWLEDNEGIRIYLPCEPLAVATLRTKVSPRYPESARKVGIEGMVWLYALIGTDGRPIRAEAIAGPLPSLSRAAEEAVEQWVYEPASLEGQPVPALIPLRVEFVLGGPAGSAWGYTP